MRSDEIKRRRNRELAEIALSADPEKEGVATEVGVAGEGRGVRRLSDKAVFGRKPDLEREGERLNPSIESISWKSRQRNVAH